MTIPVACMNAYMIVGPTNRNPRFFRALLMASLCGDTGGTSDIFFQWFWIGLASTKDQR